MALNFFFSFKIFAFCRAFCHSEWCRRCKLCVASYCECVRERVPTRHIKKLKLKACQIIRYVGISQRRMCFKKKKQSRLKMTRSVGFGSMVTISINVRQSIRCGMPRGDNSFHMEGTVTTQNWWPESSGHFSNKYPVTRATDGIRSTRNTRKFLVSLQSTNNFVLKVIQRDASRWSSDDNVITSACVYYSFSF